MSPNEKVAAAQTVPSTEDLFRMVVKSSLSTEQSTRTSFMFMLMQLWKYATESDSEALESCRMFKERLELSRGKEVDW